jgi:hypothetical protein
VPSRLLDCNSPEWTPADISAVTWVLAVFTFEDIPCLRQLRAALMLLMDLFTRFAWNRLIVLVRIA